VEPIIPSLHDFRSDPIGFAGGEYLPLPASKGLAFPFLLTSMGAPLLSANLRPACGRQVRNNGFHSELRKPQLYFLLIII